MLPGNVWRNIEHQIGLQKLAAKVPLFRREALREFGIDPCVNDRRGGHELLW